MLYAANDILKQFFWFDFCCCFFLFYSEDEARMKIYSVSTKHYFAFGAPVSEELSYEIKSMFSNFQSGEIFVFHVMDF